jgi:dTDP-4-dehydrorhamnose reductase
VRWLVVGSRGQLGRDLLRVLADRAADVVDAAHRRELDIRHLDAVRSRVHGADVVVNAAAWTDVDAAESNEEAAYAANAIGAGNVARAGAEAGAVVVHLSTDYVFDGTATSPYAEDASSAPRSAYGRTKAAGERLVLDAAPGGYLVRTAWLYGAGGRNFVRTMAGLARAGDGPVSVVADQRGSPTWSRHLARAIVSLVDARPDPGIYHATNSGDTTWNGLARAVFAAVGADPERVLPVSTAEYPRPAPRPAFSVLGTGRWAAAGLDPLPMWDVALAEAIRTEGDALLS